MKFTDRARLPPEASRALSRGRTLEAINALQETTGMSFEDSKRVVDRYRAVIARREKVEAHKNTPKPITTPSLFMSNAEASNLEVVLTSIGLALILSVFFYWFSNGA